MCTVITDYMFKNQMKKLQRKNLTSVYFVGDIFRISLISNSFDNTILSDKKGILI